MKRSPLTLFVAFLLILIFGLLLFVFQVRKSEVAVVTVFGKFDHVKSTPGPAFRWPAPINSVYKLDQRIQNFEGKFEETKLGDQNIVLLLTYTGWSIDDPSQFFPRFTNSMSAAESSLEDVVRSAKNEVAGQHPFADFISTDAKQMKFTQIEDEILQRVKRQLKTNEYGIDVKFVQIKKIGLPESVTQNVFDRMSAERQTLISAISSSGEEAATKIKSRAESTAAEIISDADAQAYKIRGEGIAAMVKSLEVFQQDPELAKFNLRISALEQLLKDKTTLVLDPTTSPLELLSPVAPTAPVSTNAPPGRNP